MATQAEWLTDAAQSWWIRLPVLTGADGASRESWGGTGDQVLAGLLAAGAVLGLLGRPARPAAGVRLLFGGGVLGLTALALAGLRGLVPAPLPSRALLVVALWLAVVPCAAAVAHRWRRLGRYRGTVPFACLLGAVWLLAVPVGAGVGRGGWLSRLSRAEPLVLGLSAERQELVRILTEKTTPEARILWEDRPASSWSALLPELTGRAFVGGLGPDVGVEHSFASLSASTLAGRPLADWTDADLERFCRRYNVGWVVAWSPAVQRRFRAWSLAKPIADLHDNGPGQLFELNRPRSFVLKGKARLVQADWHRIALADVEPEDGQVILSFHHHPGWRVLPSDVRVERDPDVDDPVPFLRLRLTGPVLRLTLIWEGP